MKKVAIVIDEWKLPTFDRVLKAAGFEYEQFPFIAGALTLKVQTSSIAELQVAVNKAQKECRQ